MKAHVDGECNGNATDGDEYYILYIIIIVVLGIRMKRPTCLALTGEVGLSESALNSFPTTIHHRLFLSLALSPCVLRKASLFLCELSQFPPSLWVHFIGDFHRERERERLELSGLNSRQKKKDPDKKRRS